MDETDETDETASRSSIDFRFADQEVEDSFNRSRRAHNTFQFRASLLLAFGLYSLFCFFVLPLQAEHSQAEFVPIYQAEVAFIAFFALFSFSSLYKSKARIYHLIEASIIQFGVLLGLLTTTGAESVLFYTLALPVSAVFILYGVCWLDALFLSAFLSIFSALTIYSLDMPAHLLASGTFNYIGFFVISAMAGYMIEYQSRFVFLQQRLNKKMIHKLKENENSLLELSITDGLTGLFNRRHFNLQGPLKIQEARRFSSELHFLLLDVDHFKEFNDFYGHPKGDDVLMAISTALKKTLRRSTDQIFRVGGEEFSIALLGGNPPDIKVLAESIHEHISDLNIPHEKSLTADLVTVSIGVATLNPTENETFEMLYKKCDKALYLAKKTGRNKTAYF